MASKESQNSPQKSKSVPSSPCKDTKELSSAVRQLKFHCASSEDLKTQLKNRPSLSPDQVNKLINDQIYHQKSAEVIGENLEKMKKTLFQKGSPQKGSSQKGSPQKGCPQKGSPQK